MALYSLLISLVRDFRRAADTDADHPYKYTRSTRQAIEWLESRLDQDVSVTEMAKVSGLSVPQFHRSFRRAVGRTPREYFVHRRIEKAMEMLAQGRWSVTEVAMRLGFSSSQYFATVFKRYTDLSPSSYRQLMLDKRLA